MIRSVLSASLGTKHFLFYIVCFYKLKSFNYIFFAGRVIAGKKLQFLLSICY